MTGDHEFEKIGTLSVDGWAGEWRTTVRVVGETKTRYRIIALVRTKLGGRQRWLEPGQKILVPKYAVRDVRPIKL